MKIWKIAMLEGHMIWVLGNGKVVSGFSFHQSYVELHPELFGYDNDTVEKEYKFPKPIDWYEVAFKSGAVRISIVNKEMGIEGYVADIRKFIATIHSLAKNHGITVFSVESPNKEVDKQNITIEELYAI